ncbi:MAG: NUDIX domain-containing protein [Anaerolineae bacterium]|nr:NUDIX domain-containing protein [Anaerolineae bacterium]
MSIFSHNVYDNVRTRVLVTHANDLLLLEPESPGDGWRLPGGGLEQNESLSECGEREVLEETGIAVKVTNVAFLREFVVPKYCLLPEEGEGIGYGLEVYLYAHTIDDSLTPRRESPTRPPPHWIPLDQVSALPVWPKELKTLANLLATGTIPFGIPSFVSQLDSPDTPAPNVDFT